MVMLFRHMSLNLLSNIISISELITKTDSSREISFSFTLVFKIFLKYTKVESFVLSEFKKHLIK